MTAPPPHTGDVQAPAPLRGQTSWDWADFLGDMITAHAPDGTYRYVSAAARDLLGYEPGDLTGRWAYDFFHPDDVPQVSDVHRTVLDGVPGTVVYRLRRKDGEYLWVETTSRIVCDADGDPSEIVCCTRPAREATPHPTGDRHEACFERVNEVLRTEAIRPVLQSIVALDGRRVVAYEALARFPGSPGHTPDRWFADAWHVGLGIPLELLAVRSALSTLPHLPADTPLCVNVSAETVATTAFLEALGDDAERVVVEITEHRQLDDAAFERKLAPLRAAGGRVAIDDFGAGYASLNQLLAIAPEWIKLDMSLTQRLDESPVARALAAALVSFAAEVGVGVVAEGVENPRQVETLRELGIRLAQGYHFGRPAPVETVLAQVT